MQIREMHLKFDFKRDKDLYDMNSMENISQNGWQISIIFVAPLEHHLLKRYLPYNIL